MRPIAVVLLVLSATVASAMHPGCVPTTSRPELDTGDTPAGRYYWDDGCNIVGNLADTCPFNTWVYEESNGIDGMQRGDDVVDDTCGGIIDPDTLIL